MKILDMSAGARAVWFDKSHPAALFLDIRPHVKPDIVCDTRDLPAEVGTGYDLIVFDPPHKNFGANSNMAKSYGHHTSAEIRDIIRRSAAEAHRVSKPGALMAFKWSSGDFKLTTALGLMVDHWEPLFGHGVNHQQKRGVATSWVMLRRRDDAEVSFQLTPTSARWLATFTSASSRTNPHKIGAITTMTKALDDIAAERHRQITVEGWTAEHDDQHRNGGMAKAAVAYVSHASVALALTASLKPGEVLKAGAYEASPPPSYWPWARSWWKPKDPRRDLVRAGALIVAEIERLDRLSASQS